MFESEATHDDGVLGPDGAADPAYRVTLGYIDRSRRYYAAQGYKRPYRWATNDSTPFATPTKPVATSRLAVVTTAFPVEHHDGPRPTKSIRMTPTEPPPDEMYTGNLFWHKTATHTDDVESFLPLRTLAQFVANGRLGAINDRFFSVPTTYSQRTTISDAAVIVDRCREDDVDLALLIPL